MTPEQLNKLPAYARHHIESLAQDIHALRNEVAILKGDIHPTSVWFDLDLLSDDQRTYIPDNVDLYYDITGQRRRTECLIVRHMERGRIEVRNSRESLAIKPISSNVIEITSRKF